MAWDLGTPSINDFGNLFPALYHGDKTTLKTAWEGEHTTLGTGTEAHKDNFIKIGYIPNALITLAKLAAGVLALGMPAGTRVIFDQDAAPTGWTRDTSYNDMVIRIVSGARSDGGSWTLPSQTITVDGHVLGVNEIPPHYHPMVVSGNSANNGVDFIAHGNSAYVNQIFPGGTGDGGRETGGGQSHSHTGSVSALGSSWRPVHRDMIIASKDAYA